MLYVAIIHGIGINGKGYSKPITDGISSQFNHILRTKFKTTQDLNFIEIVWDDLVADHQREFATLFQREFKRRTRKPRLFYWLVTFLLIGAVLSLIFTQPWLFARTRTENGPGH